MTIVTLRFDPQDDRDLRWYFEQGPSPVNLTEKQKRRWGPIDRALNGRGYRLCLYFKYGEHGAFTDGYELGFYHEFTWEDFGEWREGFPKTPAEWKSWEAETSVAYAVNSCSSRPLTKREAFLSVFDMLGAKAVPLLQADYDGYRMAKQAMSNNEKSRGRPRLKPPKFIVIPEETLNHSLPPTVHATFCDDDRDLDGRFPKISSESARGALIELIHEQKDFIEWLTFGGLRIDATGARFIASKFWPTLRVAGLTDEQILEAISQHLGLAPR